MCSRTAIALENNLHVSVPVASITTPAVPPRKKVEQLPSPLSDDTLRIVWNREARLTIPDVTAVVSLPPLLSNSTQNSTTISPKLYPRLTSPVNPPPRPPKLLHSKKPQELFVEKVVMERNGSDSPPPLPPKTYKRKQQHHHPL
uniref:Uncharacterized protein n=1 Tax=Setaria digitata TaxID=48799 RepID=A0A915PQK6_9BILA